MSFTHLSRQSFKYTHLLKSCLLFLMVFCCTLQSAQAELKIAIQADESLLSSTIIQHTLNDVEALLSEATNLSVRSGPKAEAADVLLILPSASELNPFPEFGNTKSSFAAQKDYPYLDYPDHDFTWSSSRDGDQLLLQLESPSLQGIAFALYGLLQEQLGFHFLHPKETIIPDLQSWPLADDFKWLSKPRFHKKGFHLHTQHPLELTEPLLDPRYPNGLQEVKTYIDWLMRNRQNYFEFCLLTSINEKTWPAHAKQFVDYAHERGIMAGVDISLHMIQQKSYQLYHTPPKSFKNKKKQIKKSLEWLFQADWDLINCEFATAEFVGGNTKKKEEFRLYMIEQVEAYGAKLMGRQHVVKEDNEVGGRDKHLVLTEAQEELDKKRGNMVHTVMCYALEDTLAPVYELHDFSHLLADLKKDLKVRETWYYPESAYWVTFDNSVPLLLLPYLSARLKDIELTHQLGVDGHLTFSSGWEWGYWMVDWSIARWSWEEHINGATQENTPLEYVAAIFDEQPEVNQLLTEILYLQNDYFLARNMMRYLCPSSVPEELPAPFNKQFQPKPEQPYRYLYSKSTEQEMKALAKDIADLDAYVEGYMKACAKLPLDQVRETLYTRPSSGDIRAEQLLDELLIALDVTHLRVMHRVYTLGALKAQRLQKLQESPQMPSKSDYLGMAEQIRLEGIELVRQQEQRYRYPFRTLSTRRWGHTAYHYGYLYPVHELHFWAREEGQIRKGKFSPFYKSIWNVPRIIGLID